MRGFLAILAGLATIVGLAFVLEQVYPMVFHGMSVNGVAMLLCVTMFVAEVAGGFVTGKVATSKPLFHGVVVGGIWLLVVIIGTVARWTATSPSFHVVEIMLAVPMVLLGARLASGRPVPVTA